MTFSEDVKVFSVNFNYFRHFFFFFFFLTFSRYKKKLLTSAYSNDQQLFIFNLLEVGCLTLIEVGSLGDFVLRWEGEGKMEGVKEPLV